MSLAVAKIMRTLPGKSWEECCVYSSLFTMYTRIYLKRSEDKSAGSRSPAPAWRLVCRLQARQSRTLRQEASSLQDFMDLGRKRTPAPLRGPMFLLHADPTMNVV